MKSYKYYLENLDCANCAREVEEELRKDERFSDVVVNFNLLTLSFKTKVDNPFLEVCSVVRRVEPDVYIYQEKVEEEKKDYEIIRLIMAIFLLGVSFFLKDSLLKEGVIVLIYGLLLYKTFIKAIKKLFQLHRIDENFLICISALGAYFLQEYLEGIMVVVLYVIGKILEEKALNKSRGQIKGLLDLKVNMAHLVDKNKIIPVKVEELKIDDIIVIKKGEVVPVDGVVIEGETLLDTSSLTGEAVLDKVKENDNILSGCINQGNAIRLRVTRPYFDSTVYKIFELTMNATNNKAGMETKVAKMARYYTPIVLVLAILIGVFLPLFTNISYHDSIYRALTFLVISCPCAIAISVPLSYFAGIGAASKAKVLVKGSNFLDGLPKCETIVFDKTGTLTTGSFALKEVIIYGEEYTKEEVLKLVAMGESFSLHPLAKVIMNEVKEEIDSKKVKNFQEIEGKGISYYVDNKHIKVGSPAFVGAKIEANIALSIDGKLVAAFLFDDKIKENAKEVIQELKRLGLKTVMLTGDREVFAKEIASKLEIDYYNSELLPEDKFKKLQEFMEKEKVIFVGDGVNDTPSLVESTVGISMGSIGSQAAIESSDIVLMNDSLEGILKVYKIAQKTNFVIIMNLIFALGVKIIILLLAGFGYASMAWAVFADTGVTLITILNSLRILK